MMEFELLRSFVAVVDCGGFHRAAERLNLTQSTVSQQIKRLELETKRPLFRRTTRSVALTDDGEMLLGDARRLLQFEEAARHRLAAPRLSGTVRFGRERERAVADDGDLYGAELEAVEARLRMLAHLGRMGQGGSCRGECGGPEGGRAGTQERPAVEHEHVCSPSFDVWSFENKRRY